MDRGCLGNCGKRPDAESELLKAQCFVTPNCDAVLSDAELGRDAEVPPDAALGGDATLLTLH